MNKDKGDLKPKHQCCVEAEHYIECYAFENGVIEWSIEYYRADNSSVDVKIKFCPFCSEELISYDENLKWRYGDE